MALHGIGFFVVSLDVDAASDASVSAAAAVVVTALPFSESSLILSSDCEP
jgi:hypothetical protein